LNSSANSEQDICFTDHLPGEKSGHARIYKGRRGDVSFLRKGRFVQFCEGLQSGKNASYIHEVSFTLNTVAPMVFTKMELPNIGSKKDDRPS
jgi:hypothetical protein